MAAGWVFTIPAAGVVAAAAYEVWQLFGSHSSGATVVMALLTAAAAAVLYRLAQRNQVGAEDLDRTRLSPDDEAELAAAGRGLAPAGV